MKLSYFELTVPVVTKNLTNLKVIFQRAWTEAQANQMSEADFLNQRLTEDMLPLSKQIQIATDIAKAAPARLTGGEMIILEDTETTVAQLVARIDIVIDHLTQYKPEQFEGAADRKIELGYLPGKFQFGKDFVPDFVLPNFFFHCTIAYSIIRVQGVKIGKMDFIGSLKLHDLT
jgi:hypothetical protein